MTREEINNLVVAQNLIIEGLRLPIVQHLTNIKTNTARKLWREIHGRQPNTGKLPETALGFMGTSSSACTVSAFAVFYSHFTNQNYDISARHLISSYSEFKEIIPDFDINAAYRIVSDLFIGFMAIKRCRDCSASYVYNKYHKLTNRCPFCIQRG